MFDKIYKKYLLNRLTCSQQFVTYAISVKDSEEMRHHFHKVMVHNWNADASELTSTLEKYLSQKFIPVKFTQDQDFCSFYTDDLQLILKFIKQEFMFPYQRNMFNVDILMSDKTSTELWDTETPLCDIICGVISRRFSEKFELDFSDIQNDKEFIDKKIAITSLSQLAIYSELLDSLGKQTRILNLSSNNISNLPMELMKFFQKRQLLGVNLSNNKIASISELIRVDCRIEMLWLEGNPLCQSCLEPTAYVRSITVKFPRLKELDGIPINNHGIVFPFFRNFLVSQNAKMLTEKFLTLYFTHFDSCPRKNLANFYDDKAQLTISTAFSDLELERRLKHYGVCSRNICNRQRDAVANGERVFIGRESIAIILDLLPKTYHDPNSFTVDVLLHDVNHTMIVVDGIFRESNFVHNSLLPEKYLQFRRTFLFESLRGWYFIKQEMFSISFASNTVAENYFKGPIRNLNSLVLVNPTAQAMTSISNIFSELTSLKKREVDRRLKKHSWDIRQALTEFTEDLKENKIAFNLFVNSDGLSDLSDDEVD